MSKFRGVDWAVVGLAVVVVGIVVVPKIVGTGDRSGPSPQSEMATIQGMLTRFKLDCERYPTTAEGLGALRIPPQDVKDRWGPDAYSQRDIADDLYGHPYNYFSDGRTYTLTCHGEDGLQGGEGYDTDLVVQSD